MLTSAEWEEVDQLVNGEYMTQVDDAGFESALAGVKLAQALLTGDPDTRNLAINYVFRFGNWRNLPLPREIKRDLSIRNYGEEETLSLEEAGEITY